MYQALGSLLHSLSRSNLCKLGGVNSVFRTQALFTAEWCCLLGTRFTQNWGLAEPSIRFGQDPRASEGSVVRSGYKMLWAKSRRHQIRRRKAGGREHVPGNHQRMESWGWGVAGEENGCWAVVPSSGHRVFPLGLTSESSLCSLLHWDNPIEPDFLLRFQVEGLLFSFSPGSYFGHFFLLPFRGTTTFFRLPFESLLHFFVSGPGKDHHVT